MKTETPDQGNNPVLKLAQYLAGLTIHQDLWVEIGKALVTFFDTDLVAFGERRGDETVCHHWAFSDRLVSRQWSASVPQEAISEVLESGFLGTRLLLTPERLSVAFLPISHGNLVTAVMLVGYGTSASFPKELLDLYLAVAGLVGTTSSRLASERELRGYRRHLEELVKKRTVELTESNEKLRLEIIHRTQTEAIMQARLRLSEYALTHSLSELLTKTLDEAESLTGSSIGFFHYLHADQRTVSMQTWSTNTLRNMCSAEGKLDHSPIEAAGVWADCVRERRPIIHNDFATLANRKGAPQGHTAIVRELLMPISRGDTIVGVIGVGNKATDYVEKDNEAVSQLANLAWDIVTGKRAEEEKQVLEHQLQQSQKLESLGVLAGGIAHDFNNILAIIIGYCGLIKMDYQEARLHIPTIEKAAEHAAGLCRQMLSYAGKAQLTMAQVNMRLLVDDMATMLKSTLPQNVTIELAPSTDSHLVHGDPSQLKQIVMNLIVNAAEAIGDDQGEIRVSMAPLALAAGHSDKDYHGKPIPGGRYLCLEVADNGCGMDEETKWRIFEPFFTTKFTGRGLGMSAVLGIIRSHGGALQLFSQLGQGATFKVYLPIQAGNAPADEVSAQSEPAAPWQGSGKVLLVEDEEHIRFIAVTLLRKFGFGVLEAANGKEALRLYREHAAEIILVVTDLGMPIMNGYELFGELKKLNPELPILISSGFGDAEVSSRIAMDGVAGLISKPYNPDQLRDVLKGVVEGAITTYA